MVNAGDADDVVEVVDERGEWWGADAVGVDAIDSIRDGEGDGLAGGAVRCGGLLVHDAAFVAGGLPSQAPGFVDKGGEEVDHADSAFVRNGKKLVVSEIAGRRGEGASGGMGGDDGGF